MLDRCRYYCKCLINSSLATNKKRAQKVKMKEIKKIKENDYRQQQKNFPA